MYNTRHTLCPRHIQPGTCTRITYIGRYNSNNATETLIIPSLRGFPAVNYT